MSWGRSAKSARWLRLAWGLVQGLVDLSLEVLPRGVGTEVGFRIGVSDWCTAWRLLRRVLALLDPPMAREEWGILDCKTRQLEPEHKKLKTQN